MNWTTNLYLHWPESTVFASPQGYLNLPSSYARCFTLEWSYSEEEEDGTHNPFVTWYWKPHTAGLNDSLLNYSQLYLHEKYSTGAQGSLEDIMVWTYVRVKLLSRSAWYIQFASNGSGFREMRTYLCTNICMHALSVRPPNGWPEWSAKCEYMGLGVLGQKVPSMFHFENFYACWFLPSI